MWTVGGWVERFRLPYDVDATGYGQSSDEVGALKVTADMLTGYHDAVHRATVDYLATLSDEDYPRVVDERWDPPVTLAVRLVSVLDDTTQHAGQAAYVRGCSTAADLPLGVVRDVLARSRVSGRATSSRTTRRVVIRRRVEDLLPTLG